jgi:K+-sensing histidine kinase KdpD
LQKQSKARRPLWGTGVRLYALVVGFVWASTALRWALKPLFGEAKQFLTYYPALAVASLVGGARAGLLATVLSTLVVDLFFIEPRGSLIPLRLSDWVALGLFAAGGGLISWMAGSVDQARRQERDEAIERRKLRARRTRAVEL